MNSLSFRRMLGAAALLAVGFPQAASGQDMAVRSSEPRTLESAKAFIAKLSADRFFGVRIFTDSGEFSFHGEIFSAESLDRCKMRFLIRDPYNENQRTLTRTIDFTKRRQIWPERYNNVSDGIAIGGPVILSNGFEEDGTNFGINDQEVKTLAIEALQLIVEQCSEPYIF